MRSTKSQTNCQKKVRHHSLASARKAARRLRSRGEAKVPIYTYWCPECWGWHLTRKPQAND